MNEKTKQGETKRIDWVDAMKGIAIFGVVLIHSGADTVLPSVFGKVASIGNRGVQIFFIISMYLAYASFEKAKQNDITTGKWLWKHFKSIAPAYYAALLLNLIFVGGYPNWLGSIGKVSLWNILSHIFFFNGFSPYHINSILGVEWYLADYAIMILLIPVLYKLINSFSKATAFFLGCSVVSYFFILIMRTWSVVPDMDLWGTYLNSFWFFTQLPVMALGIMLFFFLKSEYIIQKGEKNKLLSYTILIGSVYAIAILLAGAGFPGITLEVAYAVPLFGIILSQCIYNCPFIQNPFWKSIGKHSYIIYLFHVLIMTMYDRIFLQPQGMELFHWLVKYVVVFGLSYLLALLIDTAANVLKQKRHIYGKEK